MNNNTPHKPRKSRHAKRHAAEQTEPFGFDELETRLQEFRNDRRLRGAQQANADWVAEPLNCSRRPVFMVSWSGGSHCGLSQGFGDESRTSLGQTALRFGIQLKTGNRLTGLTP